MTSTDPDVNMYVDVTKTEEVEKGIIRLKSKLAGKKRSQTNAIKEVNRIQALAYGEDSNPTDFLSAPAKREMDTVDAAVTRLESADFELHLLVDKLMSLYDAA